VDMCHQGGNSMNVNAIGRKRLVRHSQLTCLQLRSDNPFTPKSSPEIS
jgi:hypothetical protein